MKNIGIEELLRWAFTFELSKVDAGGGASFSAAWKMTEAVAELGTVIDRTPNSYGVIPGFIEDGEPHPDAVLIGDAVRALDRHGFDIPDGWNPFPEFDDAHGLIAAEVESVVCELRLKGDRLAGRHIVSLVISSAVLGRGPEWHMAPPEYQLVTANGQPRWFRMKKGRDAFRRVYWLEVDGFDKKRRRPFPDAYRKYELVAPLRSDVLSRLDWQIWQNALLTLQTTLAGRLSAHRILPFRPFVQPWAKSRHAVETA
ncbi:hypothetical protein [Rhizobium straminoryzae]|uniref:Uncharacterized protein n=1 Tax=Rhizobium straminoryzae TaxID=1387186 RepID=A0A549T0W0_9HYPH|nr:hypothetical protein [Rhizobium straminoryzae]TRL35506.1 hypothetical protein FNA46_20115 [Rhizobium straminoryzae]